MKKFSVIMLTLLMTIGLGTVASAAPVLSFDIDFYGGDTALTRGVYDTGNTIILPSIGDQVMADIYVSGLNEAANGLAGWALALEYGSHLTALDAYRNTTLWPLAIRPPELVPDVRVEGFANFGTGQEGDDLLLFTVQLECTGMGLDNLVLWDWDKGGVSTDVITLKGDPLDGQFAGGITLAGVNNVPIPGALWLLGSGLLGLLGIRRRIRG